GRKSFRCEGLVSLDCLPIGECAVENDRRRAIGLERHGRDCLTLTAEPVQVVRPVVETSKSEPLDGPSRAVLLDKSPGGEDVVLRTCADEGEGCGAQRELEEPPSE